MFNKIQAILFDVKFQTHIDGDKITFYKDFPEDSITLKMQGNEYSIFEVHRESVRELVSTTSKDIALFFTIATLDNFFFNTNDTIKAREIRSLVKLDQINEAIELIKQEVDTAFSLGNIEHEKLSLIQQNNIYSLYFNGKIILDHLSPQRAYVTLFNYLKKVDRAAKLYYRVIQSVKIENITLYDFIDFYLKK
ncbi:hypothetical protein GP482_09355 [Streptococcus ruminicola]|uniref:Uncharacterized protein n=1 Tax=Streptococcus ruminicola TaxID=2686210 RepID=A0AAE6R762_9STRE|nr:hypothetical protein [Streptococcus ruminicola]QGZ28301.1 hypothetical protein GP482_09355 [Streptococcus ruminicola]